MSLKHHVATVLWSLLIEHNKDWLLKDISKCPVSSACFLAQPPRDNAALLIRDPPGREGKKKKAKSWKRGEKQNPRRGFSSSCSMASYFSLESCHTTLPDLCAFCAAGYTSVSNFWGVEGIGNCTVKPWVSNCCVWRAVYKIEVIHCYHMSGIQVLLVCVLSWFYGNMHSGNL